VSLNQSELGFLNGCLFIREPGICAASDLHIGLEDELKRQGLAFPLREEQVLTDRLSEVLAKFRPSTFVLNGDIFHSFSSMNDRVKEKLDGILRLLENRCEVILLRGSHDTMLECLELEVKDRHDLDGYTFAHGHASLEGHGTLIMGHEHPVIDIEMTRVSCFLLGEGVVGGEDLVITPAFNPLCQGVTINQVDGRDLLSPLLKGIDAGAMYPLVEVEGEVLAFPRLRGLRKHIR
jgi:hypothetical protein